MVDIRFNLFIAYRKQVIDLRTRKAITRIAKNIYFPFRNYEHIIDQCIENYQPLTDQLESFREYINKNKDSLKERDAVKTINYVKSLYQQALNSSIYK